jgi:streptomycin 6-kinase
MIDIPPEFVQRIIAVHGPRAQAWFEALPPLVSQLQDRWALEIGAPFLPLSYHYVTRARQHPDRAVVLKLGVPGAELAREAQCLIAFGGRGAVRLLESDLKLGALLLDRITPGWDIRSLDDAQAISATSDVLKRLHRPAPDASVFPTVQDWGKGFRRLRDKYGGQTGPIPGAIFARAEATFSDLANSMYRPVLLHGDLHHENILASDRDGWLAIDPQGVIGEPAYEVGAFLRNPMPSLLDRPNLEGALACRIQLFSETLGLDPIRLRGWGFAQAVLAAVWSIEDHEFGWEQWLAVANALQPSA